ncbi:hypothetical protein PRIPAC_75863 [Pristionchus pacificus]|uniref:Uncharacterized protein n=1 Tax=Pristionchus pacificus TaxID=54126 RepID=A0A2A6CF41_PRIPA|nr:hypothetical protein PRIPAC_75863 [Pristionchus pacificus]|eukprot:PDM76824.1 hypothetical protein PRIPAC_42219 [Pristionchus pacificus]
MEYYMIVKRDIFDLFVHLSSTRILDDEISHDMSIFCMCLSELRNIPDGEWFTPETITNKEEKTIRDNLETFVINFTRNNEINFKFVERDSLSGLVLFRLDILPIFSHYINPDFDWMPMMLRLCHWEQHYKRKILDGISAGNDEMKAKNMLPIKDEVRAQHRWWNNDYKESEDRIHLLNDEYNLTD